MPHVPSSPAHIAVLESHAAWLARLDTPDAGALAHMAATADSVPDVLVIARFSPVSAHLAARSIELLRQSVGVPWTASVLLDPRCDPRAVAAAHEAAGGDSRIQFEQPANPAPGLLVVLEGGALPRPHGLRLFADTLARDDTARLVYADENRIGPDGEPDAPWFKPCFSPLLVRQGCLLGRMIAIRGSLRELPLLCDTMADAAAAIGAWALKLDEAQVRHVPHILFSDALPPELALPIPPPALPGPPPMVSILIPTRDGWDLLSACLRSLQRTDWPQDRMEILVIDNNSSEPTTLRGLAAMEQAGQIRVLHDPGPFNFARLNNRAARVAVGSLLVLLNNDTEILDPAWLRHLAGHAMQPGAGAVGMKLVYPDGTVQHGGIVCGIHGSASHAFTGLGARDGGMRGLANRTREILAVTGACLAVSRNAYDAVGGMDEAFPVTFNDVALCLDLHQSGRRNVMVAEPMVLHKESRTRGHDDTPEKIARGQVEQAAMLTRHPRWMREDPYYSPNLSFDTPYAPAFAPRRRTAWDVPSIRPARVMMLHTNHAMGDPVATVIGQQARALKAQGLDVIIGGPCSPRDQPYPGCRRVEIHESREAATLASEFGVDLVIAHSLTFFFIALWVGACPPVIGYDHGDPPAEWFHDAPYRRKLLSEKARVLRFCRRVLAISAAVATESRTPIDAVVPAGNGHFGRWDTRARWRHAQVRTRTRQRECFIVLARCHVDPDALSNPGADAVLATWHKVQELSPALAARSRFILCGQGDPRDAERLRAAGLEVKWDISTADLADFYLLADAYLGLSRWEGHDFGIGQALALGLPVIASDIAAHQGMGLPLTDDPAMAARLLAEIAVSRPRRVPQIQEWSEPLAMFTREVAMFCGGGSGHAIQSDRRYPTAEQTG